MKPDEFAHKEFRAETWEYELQTFIDSLDRSDGVIWHRKKEHKKIHEELATLGYYVKYKYAGVEGIKFSLNKLEEKADGWVFQEGEKIESIQIAIAYYEHEDAIIDKRIMEGEDVVLGGWVVDSIKRMSGRVENRVKKKSGMGYLEIDTLLIGVRGWFARNLNTEYQSLKSDVVNHMTSIISETNFKELVVVDADFVGQGELLVVPNQALQPTPPLTRRRD